MFAFSLMYCWTAQGFIQLLLRLIHLNPISLQLDLLMAEYMLLSPKNQRETGVQLHLKMELGVASTLLLVQDDYSGLLMTAHIHHIMGTFLFNGELQIFKFFRYSVDEPVV